MIDLIPCEHDDAGFLALAQRIIGGALQLLRAPEVYLVHVDNWFDHKWLGWWSRWKHKELKELYVPPFHPNRIRSQKHFVWDAIHAQWSCTGQGKSLHIRQPGRWQRAVRLDRFSQSAVFVWYSGNTLKNGAGSLMLYLSGAADYAWYASLRREKEWRVDEGFHITRRELLRFEESGRDVETRQAQP
jgi:hypothetical protein